MVKNAGSASLKREKINPRTINSHESVLRTRVANPESTSMNDQINKLKEIWAKEKQKLEVF